MISYQTIRVLGTTLVLAVLGCASYPSTVIGPVDVPPASSLSDKQIDFVVSPYYLGSVDDPTDTKPSTWDRDWDLVNSVVASAISPYGSGTARLIRSGQTKAPYVCEMKIHQFVAWIEILYALLPIPHSSNESICVTATLKKQDQLLFEYSECGYSKESGFWAWSGPDRPPLAELRTFVTKKVVADVMRDFAKD